MNTSTENIENKINSVAMENIQKFIKENEEDLQNLYGILQNNFSSIISFEDFCKFTFIKTFYHIL